MNRERNGYVLSTDANRVDLSLVHAYLSRESYWAKGVPEAVMRKAIENSLCFGLYHDDGQVGFARVVSDCATFAYLADVFVVESHRGKGLATWMLDEILSDPRLQGLRRWMLATADAHALYLPYGFKALADPSRFMERHDPDVYES